MSYATVDPQYCKGCLLCVNVCPKKCLEPSGKTNAGGYSYVAFRPDADCLGCRLCHLVCPDVAITVVTEK